MSLKTTTEAAIYLGWSRELVVKLTERSPKSGEDRKLPTKDVEGATYFAEADLDGYRDYLASAWPKTGKASRPHLPDYIKDDVKAECHYQCAICGLMDNGEVAHIEAVKDALNNSPDNLIFLCPNHHTAYDYGFKVSSNVTAEVVRAAKTVKRSSRRRMLKFEAHTEEVLRTVLSLVKKAEQQAAAAEPELREVYTAEISGLLRSIPDLVQAAQADAGRDGELTSAQKVLAEKATALTKAASMAAGKSSDQKTVRSAARSVVDISSQLLLDLDEVDCPHCHGSGQTGLVGHLCAYCKGSCVVSEEQVEDYDPDDIDEVECPHCHGQGQTGLVGDLCGYCGGSCVVSREESEAYRPDALDEVDCPHCGGSGQTGLAGDFCGFCKGSCVVSRDAASEYDREDLDEVDCPHCHGSGQTGLAGDLCAYCKGSCKVTAESASEYHPSDIDEVDCPHCHGSGQVGHGYYCSYCRGSCRISQASAEEYDPEAIDEADCPHCGGTGRTGLVGDICRLCKGQTVVSRAVLAAYEEKYGTR